MADYSESVRTLLIIAASLFAATYAVSLGAALVRMLRRRP